MAGKTYDFNTLWKKYNGFEQPSFSIEIESINFLNYRSITVNELEINTSNQKNANMAFVSFHGREEEKDMKDIIDKILKIGNKVEIKLGYHDKNELVFFGYLHSFSIQEEEDSHELRIEFICLDVKGLMMSCSSYEFDHAKKMDQIIEDIIGQTTYKKYYSEKELTRPNASINMPRVIKNETDYELLCNLADYLGYEFYISEKKLSFTKVRNDTTSLMTLTKGKGIRKLHLEAKLSDQISKVLVSGISPKGERLSATELRSTKKRIGDSKLSSLLLKEGLYYLDTMADSVDTLQYMAKKYMIQSESRYGSFLADCVGIPELMPGRFINIDSATKEISGKYYIKSVRHILNLEGYFTELEGEME